MSKTILVTGGNRGIGYAISETLSREGHNVVVTCRNEDSGYAACTKLSEQAKGDIYFIQMDVNDDKSVLEAAAGAEDQFKHIDALINNAGIGVGKAGLLEPKLAEIREIMETNFYGPIRVSVAFLPLLVKSESPRIVNMSSGMGQLEDLKNGGFAGYRMSKAALNAQTIQFAAELADQGVAVNAMCPGWVKTNMGGEQAPRTPEEGADTAVWLATADNIPSGKFWRDRKEIPW